MSAKFPFFDHRTLAQVMADERTERLLGEVTTAGLRARLGKDLFRYPPSTPALRTKENPGRAPRASETAYVATKNHKE